MLMVFLLGLSLETHKFLPLPQFLLGIGLFPEADFVVCITQLLKKGNDLGIIFLIFVIVFVTACCFQFFEFAGKICKSLVQLAI